MYVREAHAADGAFSQGNENAGIVVNQPKTLDDRVGVAKTCTQKLEITMPLLVDTIDDRVGHAYSAMPDRLYLIDKQGKVAYKGGRGPFGFKPGELEQSMIGLMLEESSAAIASPR